ncbi:hypothetical protein MMC30_004621 [Trapelia coarctata]|nr:hypothetical protein [Trapelia coarctata]
MLGVRGSPPRKRVLSGLLFSIIAITITDIASALGINCRGSGLCPRATWNNRVSVSVIQLLRDAVWESVKPNSTIYSSGDHIICVSQSQPITIGIGGNIDGISGMFTLSGSIPEGGICLFPQKASLTLGQIRPLTNAILEHGCSSCGSVPIHFVDEGSNDPSSGILTFNYVKNPFCDGDCISDTGSPGASSVKSTFASGATGTTFIMSEPAAASSTIGPTESAATAEVSVTTRATTISSGATVTVTAAPSSNVAGRLRAWKGILFISMLAINALFFPAVWYGV